MNVQIEWLKAYDEYQAAIAREAHMAEVAAMFPAEFKAAEKAKGYHKEAVEALAEKTKAFEAINAQLAIELRSTQSVIVHLTRDEAIQMLGDMMSGISENIWCAGWMSGCEETIPAAVNEVLSGKAFGDLVSVVEAKQLKALADYLGHWVDFNMGDGPRYIPYTPAEFKP